MAEYTLIDLENWPRKTHWHYYRNIVKAAVSMTSKLDVTGLLKYCHEKGLSFSSVFLYAVSSTVNSLDCMKMFADKDGNPAVWKAAHPNFTIFHEDDETFSDVWIEYNPDLEAFIENYNAVIEEYGSRKGIKVRDNQPPNFFPVSGIPWVSYESFSSYTAGSNLPALFPVLNYGKYAEENGRYIMPFSISVSHAAMDGYHLAKFFSSLQEKVNSFSE